MKAVRQVAGITAGIWIISASLFGLALFTYFSYGSEYYRFGLLPATLALSLVLSLPGAGVLLPVMTFLRRTNQPVQKKTIIFYGVQFAIAFVYAGVGSLFFSMSGIAGSSGFLETLILPAVSIFMSTAVASAALHQKIAHCLTGQNSARYSHKNSFHHHSKTTQQMETSTHGVSGSESSQKFLIKGLITGGLILIMLIPTIFIQSLIKEREQRQEEVVQEVSSKWALPQNLSGPFITVPYHYVTEDATGKKIPVRTNLIIFPQSVMVKSELFPEQRTRSIYKVLLYKSNTDFQGIFKIDIPPDIEVNNIVFEDAKLCFALSDFMGIEEEIHVNFNGQEIVLNPGLPVSTFGPTGLSTPVELGAGALGTSLPFHFNTRLKGSRQFHLMPLSSTASFEIKSSWASPSFDGKLLPAERVVTDKGFEAIWNVNRANLPFGMVIREDHPVDTSISFGVTLVQPASQYNKTERSVKYAILFIGLTFAFFFIIELLQRRPFHPVQYVLVGLALVIFYALLLSISEYVNFDIAYLVAALATVLLISLYAKSHFNSWKTAVVFFVLLSALYGFIFVLISLEDTALIVGSVALFIILALAMYASRKINWYGTQLPAQEARTV